MRKFGLIGFPLTHSFSKKYFTEKFEKENISETFYELFELEDILEFPALIEREPLLAGLNVTIPHKKNVIQFLHSLDDSAKDVGAVNVIKKVGSQLKGYNSDYYGFRESLKRFIGEDLTKVRALVLGTGGAASAVQAALRSLNISFKNVSRSASEEAISYDDLNATNEVANRNLIINTTPLGMYPKTDTFPPIDYNQITPNHYLFDLVYNPQETLFLSKGKQQGAKVKDGLEMLYLQAEKAWEIWNTNL